MKFNFKKILKVSAFYLEKQKKVLFLKNIFFKHLSLNISQSAQKVALAVLVFNESFGKNLHCAFLSVHAAPQRATL